MYKNIVNLFRFLALDLTEIKSYDEGLSKSQNNSNIKQYPQIFFERPSLVLNPKDGDQIFEVTVLFLDRAVTVESDTAITDCLDKTFNISIQAFEVLKKACKSMNWSIRENSKLDLEDVNADKITGWRVQYSIEVIKPNSNCELVTNGLNFKDYVNLPIILPTACNVVFDTINLTQELTTLDIETIFTSIVGIDKYEIYIRSSLSGFTLIDTNLSPSLINNFSYPLPPPETYIVKLFIYDLCGNQTESPEFFIEIV